MTDEPTNGNGTTPDPPTPPAAATDVTVERAAAIQRGEVPDVALDVPDFEKPWKRIFLTAFARSLNASGAARVAGISRQTAYRERDNDPVYRDLWDQAEAIAVELREQVADRWAIVGETKVETVTKTTQELGEGGAMVTVSQETTRRETTEKSPQLLMFLLGAHRPERYRGRHEIRHSGHDGGPIKHDIHREPTRERMLELARLAQELELPVIDGTGRVLDRDDGVNGDEPSP